MKLDEHTSKALMAQADIPVPQGVAMSLDTLDPKAVPFSPPWIIKAQVLTGGRGKAGGIQRVENAADLIPRAKAVLGMPIKGHHVPYVRIEQTARVCSEFYLSLAVNRDSRTVLFTVNRAGGVDVETSSPDDLLVQQAHPLDGLADFQIQEAFFHLGLAAELRKDFILLVKRLQGLVHDKGLILLEINPLVLTAEGTLLALDGKIEVDDNWVDLRPDLQKLQRPEHHSPLENRARQAGLSYHKLNGRVGMVVNGAGLAMGTMDLLNDHGLAPANFLDLGGGADEARMASAFEILLDDPDVEILFVNIFGGILSCLAVARAIAKTLDTIVPDRPLVVRFSGFKAQEARAFLKNTENGQLHLVGDIQDALRTLKALTQPSVFSMAENEHESIRTAQDKAFSDIGSDCLGLDQNTPVLVQGMTGRNGALHAELMQRYGTRIVAGVTPGKGGTTSLGVPIYDTVRQALARHEIGAGIIFVPGPFAADAVLEAVEAEIPWVVCITEGIPQMHMIRVLARSAGKKSRIVGPNTPGLILPGRMKLGIMPGEIFHPGPVAVLSRSGTLTYETVHALSGSGIGQSLCLGIGGDPFIGSDFESYLPMLEKCPRTKAVLVLGEIGGQAEERLAAAVKNMGFSKPVLAFIAGRTAPPGKRFGHAGAIIQEGSGGIESKLQALREADIAVCSQLESIAPMLKELMDG